MALFLFALFAGVLGSLTGLGGGVLIVPFMTLVRGMEVQQAASVALFSVVASSIASSINNLKKSLVDLSLLHILVVGTTMGAIGGSLLALKLPSLLLAKIFGGVLILVTIISFLPDKKQNESHPKVGFFLMSVSGFFSGLLGIGSGALSVTVLERLFKIDFVKATATSNSLIGITAAASCLFFLRRGAVDTRSAAIVVMGVLIGAFIGSLLSPFINKKYLRFIYAVIVFAAAIEMIIQGEGGL